jgi:hypothetical protein
LLNSVGRRPGPSASQIWKSKLFQSVRWITRDPAKSGNIPFGWQAGCALKPPCNPDYEVMQSQIDIAPFFFESLYYFFAAGA